MSLESAIAHCASRIAHARTTQEKNRLRERYRYLVQMRNEIRRSMKGLRGQEN